MSLRKMLEDNILAEVDHGEKIALSFSGGTDSSCLLFSCHGLGLRPTLYTYSVEGYESPDLIRARRIATAYELELHIAWIPSGLGPLMKDVRMLASKYEGKVCVQCMHGHEYVAPMVKERKILNGSGIDGLYGAYRQFAFNGSRKDKATFDAERQKHLDNPNDDAMEYQRQCYAAQGVKVLYPYRQPNIIQAVMAMSWKEINKPRLKYAIVKDYPEFKMFDRYWRARGSQQIVAGTRELHDKILATPLNVKGWKTPTPIYDRIYRGEL